MREKNRKNCENFVRKYLKDENEAPVLSDEMEHPDRYASTGETKPVSELTDDELQRLVHECEKFPIPSED